MRGCGETRLSSTYRAYIQIQQTTRHISENATFLISLPLSPRLPHALYYCSRLLLELGRRWARGGSNSSCCRVQLDRCRYQDWLVC
jgi:hypothetical protein